MRKLYNHSKSTLFLMEMILSILILSLTDSIYSGGSHLRFDEGEGVHSHLPCKTQ